MYSKVKRLRSQVQMVKLNRESWTRRKYANQFKDLPNHL
ncbi:uncharacterized protein METZ01_LOCUS193415 [marine metagenome]|uniref:Uncharacterized protein n=1 Tax=marine metagenome TaxID=408172 RepID=A0A382DS56_9ZZZZ